jgi:hypothetical protein
VRYLGAGIFVVGAMMVVVGFGWMRYFVVSFAGFVYSGSCLATGLAVSGLGSRMYRGAHGQENQ